MYSVAIAEIVPGESVSRLRKLGYANYFMMQDIWAFTEPERKSKIDEEQANMQMVSGVVAKISLISSEI